MTVHGDDFIDAFAEALRGAYNRNKPEKGDSWLAMDMADLYGKLDEEWHEVQYFTEPEERPSELIDLGLLSAMLWWRENGQTTPHVPPPR